MAAQENAGGPNGVGHFHPPSNPGAHPQNSIGNQQIWDQGHQAGAIEYLRPIQEPGPGEDASLDVDVQGSGEAGE